MAGMVGAPPVELGEQRPLIGATMFGVTTPCVTRAREALEARGYEVLVFHATGHRRARDGGARRRRASSPGVLDATTTELCDDLVGGVLCAGPGPAGGGGPRRAPAGRVARRARHGQLRRARHGAAAVRGPQPVRAQPVGDADAHDRRGVRGAGAADRGEAERRDRAGRAVRAARGRLDDRRARAAVPRPRGRRGAVRRAALRRRRRTSSWSSWTTTSTTTRSPTRWSRSSTPT